MKLMFPKNPFVTAFLCLLSAGFVLTGGISAQSKHGRNSRKADAQTSEKQTRDAKKDNKAAKSTVAARRRDDARSKKDPKHSAELKRAEAERRHKEEERRQAALAERRRREQAIREARARQLAFEHGLHTETAANIMKDSTAGEDLAIRRAAVNALGHHAGSVVVMEAQTGKVLTIVNQDWAIRSGIKPCSTIKLVTGVAGLNEGVISKEDGSVRNTRTRRDLDDAIAFSDNGYFQRVGANIGSPKLIQYAKDLGLGQATGLNAQGEYAGRLPYGNNNAKIYSHGDDFEVTPLQLAVLVSEISNGGMRLIPRTPRNDIEKVSFQPFMRERLRLPQQNVRRMIPGMIGAAEYGTAHRGVDSSLGIAGKTGSCISKGSWVGLFASVAPIEKPKYSVVVITRGQGERGKYAAAVAGQIYRALSPQLVRTDKNLAQTEFKVKPRNPGAVGQGAKVGDPNEEDADGESGYSDSGDDASAVNEKRPVIVVPSAPRQPIGNKPAARKLVNKTVDSRPLFPPVVITFDKDGREKKSDRNEKPE